MTCAQWAITHPIRALLSVLVGVSVGLFLSVGVWTYDNQAGPENPVMLAPPSITVLSNGDRRLLAEYFLDNPGPCIRQGFYTLSRTAEDGTTVRFPMGGFMNGESFEKKPSEYKVEFFLPPGLPSGEALFRLKLHYTCPLALSWHMLKRPPLIVNSDWEAPPVKIVVP